MKLFLEAELSDFEKANLNKHTQHIFDKSSALWSISYGCLNFIFHCLDLNLLENLFFTSLKQNICKTVHITKRPQNSGSEDASSSPNSSHLWLCDLRQPLILN